MSGKSIRTCAVFVSAMVLAAAAPARAATKTPDTQPPSVAVTTPTGGSYVHGTVKVTGTATDNKKLSKIEVSIDGVTFKKAKGKGSWKSAFDTTAYADGAHDLFVRATDKAGNRTTESVPVDVANDSPETPPSGDAPPPPPSDPPPSDPPPDSGARSMTTPEGTFIEVTSAADWSAQQIYNMLRESGLNSTVGPTLTVKVQDTYSSQTSTSASSSGGRYVSFNATIYLKATSSTTFTAHPDDVVGHEFGHAWTLYHLFMSQQNDWSSYLEARNLSNNSKVDSTYGWSKNEIIADDYRLLFGSEKAISERPTHMNSEIPDPRNVSGLREFLQNTWTTPR
jgi:Big-like domain-containing protein